MDIINLSQVEAYLKTRQPHDVARYITSIYNTAFASQAYGNNFAAVNPNLDEPPQDEEFLLLVRFL